MSATFCDGTYTVQIDVEVRGEIAELKETINTMVDQLNAFAGEVTRVAREVGSEGKLGGQASVEGVQGIWKELTGNVNLMAVNLTNQVRNIAEVTTAVDSAEEREAASRVLDARNPDEDRILSIYGAVRIGAIPRLVGIDFLKNASTLNSLLKGLIESGGKNITLPYTMAPLYWD